jgi:RNA polymerase sigma factor (sigma-70 family)
MGKSLQYLNQSELVYAIKSNNLNVLKEFYIVNCKKVELLVLKNNGSVDHAKDIYQDAFITVWTHVKNDKFTPKNDTALQSYLYRIAKNRWTDVLRSKSFKNSKLLNNEALAFVDPENTNAEEDLKNTPLQVAMLVFKNLGQPCKQLLSTFYFNKKSLKDIASDLNIEETTARNKKYRCMQKLRALVLASK